MIDRTTTLELGRKLLDKHGLQDWKIDVVNLHNMNLYPRGETEGYMGLCVFKEKTILLDWRPRQRTVRQTILHEIAHALVGAEHGHGEVWRNKAEEIGCSTLHVFDYALRELRRPQAEKASTVVEVSNPLTNTFPDPTLLGRADSENCPSSALGAEWLAD